MPFLHSFANVGLSFVFRLGHEQLLLEFDRRSLCLWKDVMPLNKLIFISEKNLNNVMEFKGLRRLVTKKNIKKHDNFHLKTEQKSIIRAYDYL